MDRRRGHRDPRRLVRWDAGLPALEERARNSGRRLRHHNHSINHAGNAALWSEYISDRTFFGSSCQHGAAELHDGELERAEFQRPKLPRREFEHAKCDHTELIPATCEFTGARQAPECG